jgi:ribosomal protein L5
MNYLIIHYNNIVKQDFLLKYIIKNTRILPKITKLVLSAKFSGHHKGSLVSLFEILTFHKPYLCQSHTNILSLSLRKGDPVGIKLVLRKKSMHDFLIYFLFEVLPSSKNLETFKITHNSIHWQIKDIFTLDETTYMYIYLMDLRSFDIVIYGENLKANFFIACRFPI